MNFLSVRALSVVVVVVVIFLCNGTEQRTKSPINDNTTTGNGTNKANNTKVMKAFLMQCPVNFSSRNNIRITVQIAVHDTTNKVNIISLYRII